MKKTAVAALLALVVIPATAQAQFFLEGTFGAGRVDLDDFRSQGFSGDDAAGTWSAGGGYMFNPFIGIEAGYRSFGELEFTSPAAVTLKADAKGVYVGPVFETYIDRFHLNARAGGFAWESDVSIGGVTQKDDGFDAYVGLGVSYAMTPKSFFGLSFTRFRVLDEIDVDAWDLRLKFSF